jgi:hypothetical protein
MGQISAAIPDDESLRFAFLQCFARGGAEQAPVAQLDRALPSEGRGHRFESCRVRQISLEKWRASEDRTGFGAEGDQSVSGGRAEGGQSVSGGQSCRVRQISLEKWRSRKDRRKSRS